MYSVARHLRFILQNKSMNHNTFFIFAPNIMGRIIGIDYGTKRIGIAVTDPMQIIASPLTTVANVAFDDFIDDYTKKESVEAFVVGYPKKLNNSTGNTVKLIEPFIKKLKKRFPEMMIKLVDERFTSVIAMRSIIDGGVKKSDRQDKSITDKISAALILQSYLDSKK